MKANIIPMIDPQQQARTRFSQHVQSVAFNLTLSRRMIDMLRVVRDYGFPHFRDKVSEADWDQWREARSASATANGTENYAGLMSALERRGLIIADWGGKLKHGERRVNLSDAGELVCLLLVECGLIAPALETKKVRR